MARDPFGNLREWGSVLELLADLHSTGCLAECQRGLIRILRFQGNWRLREEVLKCVDQIVAPSPELIEAVSHIVMDTNNYFEVRVLASRVLTRLINNWRRHSDSTSCPTTRMVVTRLESLIEHPQPPILEKALSTCLQSLA